MPKKLAGSTRLRNTAQLFKSFYGSGLEWKAIESGYKSQYNKQQKALKYQHEQYERIKKENGHNKPGKWEFANFFFADWTEAERLAMVKYGFKPRDIPKWEDIESVVKDAFDKMNRGELTSRKAIKEIEDKIEEQIYWKLDKDPRYKNDEELLMRDAGELANTFTEVFKATGDYIRSQGGYSTTLDDDEPRTTYVGQKVEYSGLAEGKDGWRRVTKKSKIKMYYAKGSKVMGSVEGMQAVKLSNRMKGWMTPEGRFVNIDDIRQHLYSVSKTMYGTAQDVTILDIYDSLTPEQQAKAAKELMNVDWNQFYEEYINSPVEQGAYVEELSGKAGYEMLLDILMRARE